MTRRKLLSLLPSAGIAPVYAFQLEPNWLERTVTQVKLPCRKLSGIRILHLSDLHASDVVPFALIKRAVDLGLETKPDVICLTGDFITNGQPVDHAAYIKILRRLSSAAPIFGTLGNHDGGSWAAGHVGVKDSSMVRELLRASNVPLLHNRSEVVRVRGQSIRFAGVGDLWSDGVDGHVAFAEVSADDPAILLAHNPDSKDVLADHPWDLMLSGHTHGGQVVLPVVGPPFVPVRDRRYIAGLKPWNERQIYVTRGVGNVRGVRVNCRPEVAVLDLVS